MTRRSSARGLLTAIRAWATACIVCLAAASEPGPAHAREFEVVSQDESRLVFVIDLEGYKLEDSRFIAGAKRLSVPGFGSHSAPGEPAIPSRTYLVGLPPGSVHSVRHTVERSRPLGRVLLEPVPHAIVRRGDEMPSSSEDYRIDASTYESAGSVVEVVPEGPTRIRNRRVLPIRVTALSYNPASGDAVLATRIRVEVSFMGERERGFAMPENLSWDRVFSRILVNPDQSRSWQIPSRQLPRATERAFRASAVLAGPSVKLNVRQPGMHRVSAAEAIAKGLPSSTLVADLHVFKRVYNDTTNAIEIVDVPFRVIEDVGGIAGEFDGTDDVIFYGEALRDDTHNGDVLQKFSEVNAYWLGTSSGPQMSGKVVGTAAPRSDTLSTTFSRFARFEKDFLFYEESPPGLKDFYYYNNPELGSFSVPFPARGRDASGQFTMRLRFLGSEQGDALRQVRIQLQNSNGTNQIGIPVVPNKTVRTVTLSSIAASLLDEDVNTLVLRAVSRPRLKVLLNWFDIDYPSLYRTEGNVLDFHTDSRTGSVDITVMGLSRTDLMLFDVTDPLGVRECTLTGAHFVPVTGGHVLAFNEIVSARKRYILTPRDKITQISGVDVVAVGPGGLVGHPLEGGVDVLVVSHADFLNEMQRWVSYRRAQGYRVLMVDVEDVFNEFNGGNNHARAIKNFTRHFFEMGGASYLLLVGDASEDNKKVHVESMPNFVPTESFSEFIAGGFDVDEVVTTDKWYTMLDTDMDEFIQRPPGTWRWFLPDLFVGRLPAGSVSELSVMLDKIFMFEEPKGDDFWRRRMIRAADDAWSACEAFKLRNNNEIAFELAEASAADITDASMPGGFDVVRFFLSNRFAHEATSSCIFGSIHIDRCRASATPALIAELNKGATFASFQNHMNRYLMCHEWLLTSSITSPDGIRDHRRLDNFGRPWIAFGMGCHMSDYALHKEKSGDNVNKNDSNGDCMAELMLFRDNAGAVTTYGSTGFEYLAENRRYTTVINEEIFNNTPTSPMLSNGRRQARWIFGELMMQAEIENLNRYGYSAVSGNGAVGQVSRYHILGDPLLRIDAGPPRFDVTVDGNPFQSGGFLFGDSVSVVGTIVDEVAIERLELNIDGIDRTSDMTVTPLVDAGLDASRRYEVRFSHVVEPRTYDIVITASQSPDTSGTDYHTVAEFTLKVQLSASLTVNGRPIRSGELVPGRGNYVFDVTSPVPLTPSDFEVDVDSTMVTGFTLEAVKPDSTQWLVKFPLDLPAGKHIVTVTAAGSPFSFEVIVSIQVGLSQVIAYPNPFVDETYIVYTNDMEISDGRIDIFTLSGKRVRELPIPTASRLPGQNAVLWDGRTYTGDPVANGVYFYVITINQAGTSSKHRGKMMRGR